MSNDSCALNADSSLKDAKDIVFYNNLDPIDITPSARPSSSNPHPSKDAFSMLLQARCKPDAENVYSSTGSMSQKCALSGTTELQLAQKKVVSSPLSDDSLDDSDAGNDTNPLESGTDQPGAEDEAEDEAEPECEDEVDDEAETTVQATLTKSECNADICTTFTHHETHWVCNPCKDTGEPESKHIFQGGISTLHTYITNQTTFNSTRLTAMLQGFLCTLVLFQLARIRPYDSRQSTLDAILVTKAPMFTKAGLLEYIMEFIVTEDEVLQLVYKPAF
ncbi:hypothetical protein F4604DRAFT_1937011 [Suillus subluteus]|nr:hypothetical protein F4604DRAFT_1937011 [Suillus subluteus]